MSTSDPRRDDLAAYALGALDSGAVAELEEHLAGCPTCGKYLKWLGPAVALLPASVEQLRAPASVRKEVMAEVRADAARSAPPQPRRRFNVFGLSLRPALAFGAAASLVIAGVAGYLIHGSGGGASKSVVAAQPTAAAKPGTVSASLERVDGSATLVVNHMPPLPGHSVYEVWSQHGSVMKPESTFVLSSDGTATAAVPGPLDGAAAVLVTKEPRGGSKAPTSPPLLRAPLG